MIKVQDSSYTLTTLHIVPQGVLEQDVSRVEGEVCEDGKWERRVWSETLKWSKI